MLLTVVGQAFSAAGYELEKRPVEWTGGRFRFTKHFDNGLFGFIEYQLLSYADTMWAAGNPSRFRVTLTRSNQPYPNTVSKHSDYVRRSLSALVVADFGVAILPDADYWWEFRTTQQLGNTLAEAGHLVVGYGIPWLSGDLAPPSA